MSSSRKGRAARLHWRYVSIGVGTVVLAAGAVTACSTGPEFSVGDCVRVEQQVLRGYDLKSADCASAVGTLDFEERVHEVISVIDGTDGSCDEFQGFFPIEFVHEPDDVTYCLVMKS